MILKTEDDDRFYVTTEKSFMILKRERLRKSFFLSSKRKKAFQKIMGILGKLLGDNAANVAATLTAVYLTGRFVDRRTRKCISICCGVSKKR